MIEEKMRNAKEIRMAFMPLMLPMPLFKFLNDVAIKEGKTTSTLMTEAIKEKIEKLGEKYPFDIKEGKLK